MFECLGKDFKFIGWVWDFYYYIRMGRCGPGGGRLMYNVVTFWCVRGGYIVILCLVLHIGLVIIRSNILEEKSLDSVEF